MFLNRRWLVLTLVVALIAVGIYFWQGDDAERAVRDRLDALIELVEKEGAVSTFEALGRGRQLGAFFTKGASVEYYPRRTLPRSTDAMAAAFVSVWGNIQQASMSILEHTVRIDDSGRRAESILEVAGRVTLGGTDRMEDTLTYRIYWSQVEDIWLIDRVVVLGAGSDR